LDFQKYNIKEKEKKVIKLFYIYILYMKFALKTVVFFFFCKVIVGSKMKIKGIIEDLIFLFKNLKE